MSIAGSIYLTGGCLVYAYQPQHSWVCLVLFGLAAVAVLIDFADA